MHFIHLDLVFGFFNFFFGFLKIDEYFVNFWVGFCLNDVVCSYITFHLHFLTIFHALEMYVSMLESCVMVGLDWAESMMKFLLHVTCLCIVHAYVHFHLFLVHFCFSLSLSLSDSLRMALKSKTTPS